MNRGLALFGGVLMLLSAASAFGDTLVMRCAKSSCVRSRCDEWGENCSTIGYFQRADGRFAVPQSHQVCNEFGDCHFARPSFPPIHSGTQPGDSQTPQ